MPDKIKVYGGAVPPLGLNILIVDDEANTRKTLAMAVEVSGHRVTAVSNGKEQSVASAGNDKRKALSPGPSRYPSFAPNLNKFFAFAQNVRRLEAIMNHVF